MSDSYAGLLDDVAAFDVVPDPAHRRSPQEMDLGDMAVVTEDEIGGREGWLLLRNDEGWCFIGGTCAQYPFEKGPPGVLVRLLDSSDRFIIRGRAKS